MSMLVSGEPRIQNVTEIKGTTKCRIPQRLQSGRNRLPFNNVSKPKESTQPRPMSANRLKDDLFTGRSSHPARFPRTDKFSPVPKRPSALPKMTINETAIVPNKTARTLIMVPLVQRPPGKNLHKNTYGLPDQATITKHEDLELRESEFFDDPNVFNNSYDTESITSPSDKAMQLKISWQEKMVQFEKMKNDLTDRQKAIMELYAVMRDTQQKMSSVGETACLPPADELRIMNVTKMTPEQLLQLCAGSASSGDRVQCQDGQAACKSKFTIDLKKLNNMPLKLVTTCEQTLMKRKEIIDWFDSLKSQDKGISVHKLSKKINEFNAENEMLKCSLEQVKAEFIKEIEDFVNYLRKGVNETIALQLRNEELTYELSELNSQNADLRKQIHNADHLRSQTNKTRVEELQKELKEEKCKRIFLRDRLSRAEGQVKMNQERATQLEAALDQARSQSWSLERTIQQLHEQNQKLQNDFDKELSTLTESIREHTANLEEISNAREKLQIEKDDLANRLKEIAEHYNDSIQNTKHEMNVNVAKLIETEKKCEQEVENKIKLEAKVECLCTQLLQSDLRIKDMSKLINEKEIEIDAIKNTQNELEITRQELDQAHLEITDYKNGLTKQNELIADIERRYKESIDLNQTLKDDLTTKEEYIAELKKKHAILEQQELENETKMEGYIEQLTSLKTHISQLQKDFGDFENLDELHEKVNHQRELLQETTRQNGELAEALQKKEEYIDKLSAGFAEQESSIVQQDGVIKILSEKDEEQSNIIQILRNNLELRSQTDIDFNQQLKDKNEKIDSLIMDLDMSKQQMSNLEKIILTMQDQTRKASIQRKKDQDKITMLQNKISEYEAYHTETSRTIDAPTENLDNLIKIIEDELGSSVESEINSKDHEYIISTKKRVGDRKRNKLEFHENIHNESLHQPELEKYPNKFMLCNYVKKSYISPTEKYHEGDNLDRKKVITSINQQKWQTDLDKGLSTYNLPANRDSNNLNIIETVPVGHEKPPYLIRNLQYTSPNQFRDDRKSKMYKIAGHRL